MHVVARGRHWLARHPSVYWLAVTALAAVIGSGVAAQVSALEDARRAWGTTRTVLVATTDLTAGAVLHDGVVEAVALPDTALPPSALSTLPPDARLRQRVVIGEVLVAADVTDLPGPAAGAPDGTVVVALRTDHDLSTPSTPGGSIVGLAVQVVADGLLLADDATIVDVSTESVFVAVDLDDGPAVAAAERAGAASLLFLAM